MSIKLTTAAITLAALATPAFAQGYHLNQGYTTQQGTYVPPHYQTNPNNTTADNWSTRGNTNPYTGQAGTVNPSPGGYGYQQPSGIYGTRRP